MLSKTILILLPFATAYAQFTAAPNSPFAVGSSPQSVASGDFNGDGKPDIVTANAGANTVSVLLGSGSGGFSAAAGSPFSVGTNPESVAVGDFNGDGKLDIATANSGANSVTVLLGNGKGGFTAAPGSPFTVGTSPVFVAVGDFNGDGKADLVTANSVDNTITVLLGNGSGGFTAAAGSPVAVGLAPQAVAVGDLNRDGDQDLVVANYSGNGLTVLLGNGSGGFTAAAGSPVAVGASPVSVVLADLNGDGKLDIVAANSGDNTLTVLLGAGAGTFAAASGSPVSVGSKLLSVAVTDFNGDGAPDIVAVNSVANNLTVLLGNGSGGFTAAPGSPFVTGSTPVSVALADFNGDGEPDLAIANLSGSTVSVYLNSLPAIAPSESSLTVYAGVGLAAPAAIPVAVSSATGGGTYTASSNSAWLLPSPATNATGGSTRISLSAIPGSLAPGVYSGKVRFSAPGFFDGATAVTFSLATPSGTLQAVGSPIPVGASPESMAAGDFNRDGYTDLITANYANNTVSVLLGNGSGGFAAAPGSPFAVGVKPDSVAVADFNGDGIPDVVTANYTANTVSILLGNGQGGFTAAAGSPFATGSEPRSVAVGDFNGDGKPDLVVANAGDQTLSILLGDGTGGFGPVSPTAIPLAAAPQSVAVGDFNGDGRLDIVTVSFNNKAIVLLGNGAGGFSGLSPNSVGSFPQFVAVADLNADGKLDIVTANSGNNTVTVLLGNGSGGFTAATGSPFAVGMVPQSVLLADVNGDGVPDLVTANAGDDTISVLLGTGSGGFTSPSPGQFYAGSTPFSLAAGDFNNDGRTDLAVADAGSGGAVTILVGAQTATSSALTTTAAPTLAYGVPIPLTLRVSLPSGGFNTPTGAAKFLDGGTVIGTAAQTTTPYTFNTSTLQPGSHTLSATYGSDMANTPSASNTITLTVNPASQTITFGALTSKAYGSAPFTVTATASSGLPVSFASITPTVCTVSGAAVTVTAVGSCTVEASQAGSSNYAAATLVDQNFMVTQASQTIAFGPIPNTAIGTGSLSLTATASSGLAVSFASTTASVCTVSGATATMVSTGTCTIQATQPGNTDYAAATPASQHFSVTPASQSIAFAPLTNETFGIAPFTVSATTSSGLTVTFASATASVCTVSGATVTLAGAGTCTVQASQAGNSTYAAAPQVSQSFKVTQGSQTIVFGPIPNTGFGIAPVPLTATASSGLSVSFASNTSAVCTVSGSNATLVSGGICTIQATQAGNNNYAAATPVIQSLTVTPGNQIITFASLANKALGTAPFTVMATASSALPVSFASTTSATCTVAGAIMTLLAVGTCTIEASQPGNATYNAAIPVDQNLTVTPGAQTITFAALSNMALGSAPFTVSATASSGLPVAFASTTSMVCTVSGAIVTLVSTGTCTIQATQPGGANYAAAPAVSRGFMVTPQSQFIVFGNIPNQLIGAPPFALTAIASSGLTVTFTSTTAPVCTVSGGTVTLVSAGTCAIQAAQAGNSTYAAAPAQTQSFTVSGTGQTITFGTLPSKTFGTAPFTISATASSGLPVTFTSTTTTVCTVSSATVTLVSVGACTIQATQPGNASYSAAPPVGQQFIVMPASQTITFGALTNKTFGTAPFAVSATVSSGLSASFASTTATVCTVSGSTVTLVSAGTCTVEASQQGNASYAAATPVDQSFTIAPANQTITFGSLPTKALGASPPMLMATASSGLTVTFASTTAAVCTVTGTTITLVSAGTCTIEASQPGNANYNAATPVDQNFMVTPGGQTITFGVIPAQPFGPAPLPLTATASSGLAVVYSSATSSVCTVSGAAVTFTGLGTCSIQASQPGNASYTAATSVTQSFMVTQGTQAIAFPAIPNQPFGLVSMPLSATASSGLNVSFTTTTASVCTVSGAAATLVSLGTCTIQAAQAGNADYAAAPSKSQSFTVTQGIQTIAFPALPNEPLGAAPFTVAATASSGLPVSFASTTPAACTVSGTTVTLLIEGACTIEATQPGNTDYTAAPPVAQTFAVGPAVIVISVLNAASYAAVPLASDSYIAVFGRNFSTLTAPAGSLALPITLAGATVTITDSNGVTVPSLLYYVSPDQINFVVPEGLAFGSATVTATDMAGSSDSFPVTIQQVSPALFTADASGKGVPAAIAFDYDLGGATQAPPVFNCNVSVPVVCTPAPIDLGPASINVFLALFGTGIRGRSSLAGVSVTIGGTAMRVTYAGAQGTYPGLDQVNLLLNRSLIGQGPLILQLTVDGVAANPVVVDIK